MQPKSPEIWLPRNGVYRNRYKRVSSRYQHNFLTPTCLFCFIKKKRYGAGGNTSAHSATIMSTKKLEESTEAGTIAKVDLSLRKAIQQARMAKKMTQKELATAINEKTQVVAEYGVYSKGG